MNMKKKVKEKLAEVRQENKEESSDVSWENARHAIDIILESNKYYLVIVKYNESSGQIVNKIDLGSMKAAALRKAGFFLGDKVLKGKDMDEKYLNE